MNIFILDESPLRSAEMHCDKHVIKMILESTQMLSTVLNGPYKPTHAKHPCTLWAGRSRDNAVWLWMLANALHAEWQARWSHTREHKCKPILDRLISSKELASMPSLGLTPFAQAMPEEYKHADAVTAYRAYYRSKPFVAWSRGPTPFWW